MSATGQSTYFSTDRTETLLGFLNPARMLADLYRRRDLLWQFTIREIQGRYRGSYLGMVWALITPLLTLMVYTFVFHTIFHARWGSDPNENFMVYATNMFSGIIAYSIFSESVTRSPGIIVQNSNLVKKVVFPLEVLPVSLVGSAVVHSLLAMVIMVVGAICGAGALHWTIIFLPVVFLPVAIFACGFCWFLSSLGVFLRDIGNVVQVVVQLLFFATPITYPLSRLSETGRKIMWLNPLAAMIANFRRVVNVGVSPDWTSYLVTMAVACVFAVLGYAWFMKIKRAFADVI
jgi:lipopolysaccharide transport system permease protein